MTQVELKELPKGCTYIPTSGFKALFRRVLPFQTEMDPKKWEKKWGERERKAKSLTEAAIRYVVSRRIDQALNFSDLEGFEEVDPKIGENLTNRTLLAQGLRDIQDRKMVIVTNNRMGLPSRGSNPIFATGEAFSFGLETDSLTGRRTFEANFIGVILNVESPAVRSYKNGAFSISGEALIAVMNAVLNARKRFLFIERRGNLAEFFTQDEMDRGIEWTLFGK